MEIKKTAQADLENKRLTYLLIGFVMVLAFIYIGFEWATSDLKKVDIVGVSDIQVEEELIPITRQETPPPPPPPAPAVTEVLSIVDNNTNTDDNTDFANLEDQKPVAIPVYVPPATVEEDPDEKIIFTVVEDMPKFPGGDAELMKYIAKSIKYPVIAQENGIQGRVICEFVVEKTGKVTDAKVLRGVDPSLDKEALRVINSMPTWSPGKQRGKAVRVKFTVPINFRLQ